MANELSTVTLNHTTETSGQVYHFGAVAPGVEYQNESGEPALEKQPTISVGRSAVAQESSFCWAFCAAGPRWISLEHRHSEKGGSNIRKC